MSFDVPYRFYCDDCLEAEFTNKPKKRQALARCHGCDDIVLCSEFPDAKALKMRPELDMPWEDLLS